jgi:hypothetical protein
MPPARPPTLVYTIALSMLVVLLLACVGPLLIAGSGNAPAFVVVATVWPDSTLTIRNGPEAACHPMVSCPPQYRRQFGISIWFSRKWTESPAHYRVSIRRLLYVMNRKEGL